MYDFRNIIEYIAINWGRIAKKDAKRKEILEREGLGEKIHTESQTKFLVVQMLSSTLQARKLIIEESDHLAWKYIPK